MEASIYNSFFLNISGSSRRASIALYTKPTNDYPLYHCPWRSIMAHLLYHLFDET